jgi:hypothetical protein
MILIKHRHTGQVLLKANGKALTARDMQGASLSYASLAGLDCTAADLSDADLTDADLSGATLWVAELSRARLVRSSLREAMLGHACLQEADLTGADLTGARYNGQTQWPCGFDPAAHGAIFSTEEPDRQHQRQGVQAILSGLNAPEIISHTLPEYRVRLEPSSSDQEAVETRWTRLGGDPLWIQGDCTPSCPKCGEEMSFIGQIESFCQEFTFGDSGLLYVFHCWRCREGVNFEQFF